MAGELTREIFESFGITVLLTLLLNVPDSRHLHNTDFLCTGRLTVALLTG